MAQTPDQQMARLVEQLQQDPGLVARLPGQERAIVQAALDGQSVHEISTTYEVSEGAVWELLSNAARAASGTGPVQPVETGGLGSDTDPGVTGGYGETGFGSLGNEPPVPIPEEPPEEDEFS